MMVMASCGVSKTATRTSTEPVSEVDADEARSPLASPPLASDHVVSTGYSSTGPTLATRIIFSEGLALATPSAAMEAGGTTSYVISIIADDVALRHTPRTTFATTTVYLNVPRLRLSRAMVCTLSPVRFPAHLPPAYSVARSPASQLQSEDEAGRVVGLVGVHGRARVEREHLADPHDAVAAVDRRDERRLADHDLDRRRVVEAEPIDHVHLQLVRLRRVEAERVELEETRVDATSRPRPRGCTSKCTSSEVAPAFSPGQSATDACAKIVNFDGTSMSYRWPAVMIRFGIAPAATDDLKGRRGGRKAQEVLELDRELVVVARLDEPQVCTSPSSAGSSSPAASPVGVVVEE